MESAGCVKKVTSWRAIPSEREGFKSNFSQSLAEAVEGVEMTIGFSRQLLRLRIEIILPTIAAGALGSRLCPHHDHEP